MQELLDRESIRDCIYRCCRGIDRADDGALRSAYWPDAACRHATHQGSGARTVVYDWIRQTLLADEMDDAAFGVRLPTGGQSPHDPLCALLAHPSFTRGSTAHS